MKNKRDSELLEKLDLKDPGKLARELKQELLSRGLDRYRSSLRHIPARQYRTMLRMAK